MMFDDHVRERLAAAESLGEVKEILKGRSGIDAEQAWKEVEKRRSAKSELLDLEELDAVSGGDFRDWQKEGCAATGEWDSWCGSNDACIFFDVTYCNFWTTCPDGHEHEYAGEPGHIRCRRCGAPDDIFVG